MTARPLEIRVTTVILVVAALAFVGLGLTRTPHDLDVLTFPIGLGLVGLLSAVSVHTGLRLVRKVVLAYVIFAALAHALFALGDLPVLYRIASGILAAAHCYAAVLLLTKPAREFFQKGTP
ncbi:hypothetical protein [Actinokineospora enzanensis]|uniref:hypothetical protein n=1 Tax=Actinokineospora enzanensis TaxID=155975 RepID=UPI00037AFB33|nr:hypothetical protein [Actinokineospora enzanensis]